LRKRAWNFAQWNVRCDQRDRDFPARQAHREIFDAATLREKFRLPWELEANVVHPGFMNRPRYDCVELAASAEYNGFFERSPSGTRSFRRGIPGSAVRIFTNGFVIG
jgi:hypothetical protein